MRRAAGGVAAAPADVALVAHGDHDRRTHLEHAAGDELVAGGGVAVLEAEEVPIELAAVGGESHARQEQGAGQMVGDDFAGADGGDFWLDAERGEDAVGDAFADLVGDGPLQPLGAFGGADDDRALRCSPVIASPAGLVGEANEAAADRHGFVLGDDQADALGEERGVDGRLGDAGFPENVGGAIVDGGGEFFGGDFGEHGRRGAGSRGRRSGFRLRAVCICSFVHYLDWRVKL